MLDTLYDNGSLSFKRILYERAKECAKIAVNEILEDDNDFERDLSISCNHNEYWNEVLTEIENI